MTTDNDKFHFEIRGQQTSVVHTGDKIYTSEELIALLDRSFGDEFRSFERDEQVVFVALANLEGGLAVDLARDIRILTHDDDTDVSLTLSSAGGK